jgi:hypothetical protein
MWRGAVCGGQPMLEPDHLRAEAERCFRLARSVAGTRLAGELEALGRKLEYEAEGLEAQLESRPMSGPALTAPRRA